MPEDRNKLEQLNFTDSNGTNEAILGTLEGPCADFMDSTRNNRQYDESLWDKVFNQDPIVDEMIANGGIPGELDHPVDREETDSSRIAILMREKPIKKNGGLWAKFDIVNTPLGKIAYALAKAGFRFGISSRGSGDLYTGMDGKDHVDEDTYDFRAFDLVLLPAVKSARLNLVTEGLQKTFDYKKALKESLESTNNKADRKLMEDTLKNLDIDFETERVFPVEFTVTHETDDVSENLFTSVNVKATSEKEAIEKAEKYTRSNKWGNLHLDYYEPRDFHIGDRTYSNVDLVEDVLTKAESSEEDELLKSPAKQAVDIDAEVRATAADDDGAMVIEQLQNVLARNQKLEDQLVQLNEKLSVCYAKESAQEDRITAYKSQIARLTENMKKSAAQAKENTSLTERLNSTIKQSELYKEKYEAANDALRESNKRNRELFSKIQMKETRIKELTESISGMKAENEEKINNALASKNELIEQLEGIKKDSAIKNKEYSEKLAKANKLVEKYQRIAKNAADKYIQSKADMIGVSPVEVKTKLGESFALSDVDKVIDDMSQYQLNMSNLPFDVSRTAPRVKLTESKKDSLVPENDWDTLDPQLLMLADLK